MVQNNLINISEELAFLIRGFFATPVMSALSRLGAFEIMLGKPDFTPKDFPAIRNQALLGDTFRYLSRIGLLTEKEEGGAWSLAELGKQIFQRASSFYVPHSYHEYMEKYYGVLTGENVPKPAVDRVENVIGSGKTHLRYFPFATSHLKRRIEFDALLDIGCGDGKFLSSVLKTVPGKAALGVDFSPVSVEITQKNLRREFPQNEVEIVCADAFDIQSWGPKVKHAAGGKKIAISMWFLIHEISANDPGRITAFLKQLHAAFPEAPLMLCEIVRHDSKILAEHCKGSVMPEYLFFHDISGQGVLSWKEYNQVLQASPYEIQTERLFDEIPDAQGNSIPSSFIWCLTPKGKA